MRALAQRMPVEGSRICVRKREGLPSLLITTSVMLQSGIEGESISEEGMQGAREGGMAGI